MEPENKNVSRKCDRTVRLDDRTVKVCLNKYDHNIVNLYIGDMAITVWMDDDMKAAHSVHVQNCGDDRRLEARTSEHIQSSVWIERKDSIPDKPKMAIWTEKERNDWNAKVAENAEEYTDEQVERFHADEATGTVEGRCDDGVKSARDNERTGEYDGMTDAELDEQYDREKGFYGPDSPD